MNDFFQIMTFDDIMTAALVAFLLTFLFKRFFSAYKFMGIRGDIHVNYDTKNFKDVIKGCYDLFPKDIITFRGDTFKRGMSVQILTNNNKIIKGEIVGLNNENMLCLITQKYIIAQELSQILMMTPIETESAKGER